VRGRCRAGRRQTDYHHGLPGRACPLAVSQILRNLPA
jgi:hypothetical protein